MTKIHRRRVLQLSGAGAAAAATGGLAGILASGRAPAYGQALTVHWLRWSDFVPSSDVFLKGAFIEQCQKDLGIKLTVETINANDIQARVTSAIQSGAGPDIFYLLNNWPQLYGQSAVDVSDIADELGKAQGGFYDICNVVGTMGGKWIGVPYCVGGGLVAYRKSWLAEGLGHLSHGRQEAEGGRPSLRPDRRPYLWRRAGLVVSLSVVVGRQGG